MNKNTNRMLIRYFGRFIFRIVIFTVIIFLYFFHQKWLYEFFFSSFVWKIAPFHVLWIIFISIMLIHFFPNKKITMAARKTKEQYFEEKKDYNEPELYRYIKQQNIRAWNVMILWVSANIVLGFLYLSNILGDLDMWMLTVFYYCGDLVCILLFCPFQRFWMKSQCCINCRIFDWGHFMMFSPLIFIKGFFTWSLFFMGLFVLIKWEISYTKHPERFWVGSNENLQCGNCEDKLCEIKKSKFFKKINL